MTVFGADSPRVDRSRARGRAGSQGSRGRVVTPGSLLCEMRGRKTLPTILDRTPSGVKAGPPAATATNIRVLCGI
jgi:hypothetical protein